ncbi:DUF3795 domain-containing protein [candidate division KSB1 bacterium]|nr:DUF3795 domain-containing protein [candidate division KSB1 bacterium]
MTKDDIAYCGLDCSVCQSKFAEVRKKIESLDDAFETVNMEAIAKVIPFMRFNYFGYKKLAQFYKQECPGCRNKGGNPFCSIRKCAIKKGYFTCAECDELCGKFKALFKVHTDNEIQNNIQHIRENSIESMVQSKSE